MSLSQKKLISKEKIGGWFSRNKSIIPWILLGLAIVLIIFLWKREEKVIVTDKNNTDLIQKVKEAKDLNDKTWSVLQAVILTEAETRKRNDSLAHALGLKPKFIQGRDEYHYQTFIKVDTITTTRVVQAGGDTAYKAVYQTPWTNITAIAGPRTSSIELDIKDTLTRVEKVKTSLFGRTIRETMIRNANPDIKMVSGYSFRTKEKDVWLSIGPMAGVDIKGRPIVGVGVQVPIIKFRR